MDELRIEYQSRWDDHNERYAATLADLELDNRMMWAEFKESDAVPAPITLGEALALVAGGVAWKSSGNQRGVLRALRDHGPWPFSGWFWENRSTATRILDSLEKRGLVEWVPTWDGRSKIAKITDAGREAIK